MYRKTAIFIDVLTDKENKMKIREARLRCEIRTILVSNMGNSAPLVYEGFLSDTWNTIKNKAADFIKNDTPEEELKKAEDAMEKEQARVAELERLGTKDAWGIFRATNGFGTDEKAVKDIVATRSSDLNKLSDEYKSLLKNLDRVGTDFKAAAKEIVSGTKTGAKVGAVVMTPLALYTTVVALTAGSAAMPGLLAAASGYIVGGSITGAKIGTLVKGIKSALEWGDKTITSDKSLADKLQDEGMDKESELVRAATK